MSFTVSARSVTKRYGGVVALTDGSLEVHSGEVMALLGANGSGKSTLSKIITGVAAPGGGQLLVNNRPVQFASPRAAKQAGITAVYQELSLVPQMTVAENIWLAHEPRRFGLVDRRALRRQTQALLDLFAGTTSPRLRPETPVSALPPDERQIVEILKALSNQPRLLILDEATASLDSHQVQRLFDLVQTWKQQQMAIIFITHRMDEIFRVADRATVLLNGRTVGVVNIKDVTGQELVTMMIEAAGTTHPPAERAPVSGAVRLAVDDLHTATLQGVSLTVHDGELLGIGGLQGQGQSDLLLAIFGAVPFSGQLTLAGEAVHFRHPQDAMRRGVAFVPGDRASEGLLLMRSILENLQLPSWSQYGLILREGQARQVAGQTAADLRLVMASLDAPVSSLSGGNAQKVVIGKWLQRQPRLLLLNDPTKGVDVGAKGEFYSLLADLRRRGTAILFYSSDDEELLTLCDRVLVLHDGRIRAELTGAALNRASLVAAAMGAT
jgi:ribose transport system ATP-binding protein